MSKVKSSPQVELNAVRDVLARHRIGEESLHLIQEKPQGAWCLSFDGALAIEHALAACCRARGWAC